MIPLESINWWEAIKSIFEWFFAFFWFFMKMMWLVWPAWLLLGVVFGVKLYFTRLNREPVKFSIGNLLFKASAAPAADKTRYATKYSRLLRDELHRRGIEPIMEYSDGHKTVDLAILPARIYIEVDGIQHLNNPAQIIRDLKRDYYSSRDGFYTIRIPNEVLKKHPGSIADALAEVINEKL